MRNILLIVGALLCLLWWYAEPYASFLSAKKSLQDWDYSTAERNFTKAIDSGRLLREVLAEAYSERADARGSAAYNTPGSDEILVSALADISKAIELRPDYAYYYRERGTVYADLGAYNEAFADFEKLEELEGERPFWGLVRKAGLLRRLGEYEASVENLNEVLRLRDYVPAMPIYYHLGHTYMKMGEHEKAVSAFDAGVPAQPDYSSVYIYRACAKARLGDLLGALEDYEHGLSLRNEILQGKKLGAANMHDKRIYDEEKRVLNDLANGVVDPVGVADNLCERFWWGVHIDIKRDRSPLLK